MLFKTKATGNALFAEPTRVDTTITDKHSQQTM